MPRVGIKTSGFRTPFGGSAIRPVTCGNADRAEVKGLRVRNTRGSSTAIVAGPQRHIGVDLRLHCGRGYPFATESQTVSIPASTGVIETCAGNGRGVEQVDGLPPAAGRRE